MATKEVEAVRNVAWECSHGVHGTKRACHFCSTEIISTEHADASAHKDDCPVGCLRKYVENTQHQHFHIVLAAIKKIGRRRKAKAAKLLRKIANALGNAEDCGDDKNLQCVPDRLMKKLMKWRTTKPAE